MQIDTVENALFSITINPLLGFLMSCSNKECPRAGELDKMIGLAKQLDVDSCISITFELGEQEPAVILMM